jgi:hypothetical protein
MVSINASPYMIKNRLADVLALIQSMGFNERYRETAEQWAFITFGEPQKAKAAETVFQEHPEFFRDSVKYPGQFSLVARRSLPRRWDTRAKRLVDEAEYSAVDRHAREAFFTRPALSADQINKLLDIAVTLHDSAFERHRDRRWLLTALLPVATALVGTAIGALVG